jgi:hypothetical protein
MWIKEPGKTLVKSLSKNLNFLFKSDNIYIMDNHLAAGWAWLNRIDIKKKYNLFHIDRHYDLLDFKETINYEIISKNIKLNELDLQDYLELKQPMKNGQSAPLFRWDNYIANLHIVFPNLFALKCFATHKDGYILDNFIDYEIEFQDLLVDMFNYIANKNKNKWILNLDIDYFFSSTENGIIQFFSDKYIIELSKVIKKVINNIEVLTICLSPECCGGWEIAIEKNELICNELGIGFKI